MQCNYGNITLLTFGVIYFAMLPTLKFLEGKNLSC